MAIRIVKFEVWKPSKEARGRWCAAAELVQQATNCIWQAWLVWHVQRGTPATLRQWLTDLKSWHSADKAMRGEKPKCPQVAVPRECSRAIYAAVKETVPALHDRPLALTVNAVVGLIKSRKAAAGSLPGWVAILLCRESIPSSTRSQPIPFDKRCAALQAPLEKGGRFRLSLRTDRYEATTKRGTAKAGSHLDEVELLTNRRGIRGQEARLWRIMDGKDKLKGSSLYWDRKRSKWFALLAVEQEQVSEARELQGVAVLCPGRDVPFRLLIGNRVMMLGHADHVADVRRAVVGQRRSRQEHYRYGQRSSKGHGHARAIQSWDDRLMRRWRNFQTTYNHDITSKALRMCAEAGVARLVYLQPAGPKSETRCLAKQGREGDYSEGWAWFQVGAFLNYKAKGSGVQVEIRKCEAGGSLKKAG